MISCSFIKGNKTLCLTLQQGQAFRQNKFTNTVSNDISDPVAQSYTKQIKLKLAYCKILTKIILFRISGSLSYSTFSKQQQHFLNNKGEKSTFTSYQEVKVLLLLMTHFL